MSESTEIATAPAEAAADQAAAAKKTALIDTESLERLAVQLERHIHVLPRRSSPHAALHRHSRRLVADGV